MTNYSNFHQRHRDRIDSKLSSHTTISPAIGTKDYKIKFQRSRSYETQNLNKY